MLQIVFNDISAAELSRLPTQIQFQLLEALNIQPADLDDEARLAKRFGILERSGGKKLYRCRAGDYRIYFAIKDKDVRVHRVLHKNTFTDFLYRSNLPGAGEDEALSQSKNFWKLIDEGAKTLKIA
jgi:mRNA-degrading endonuclease RelE of RelBE toxin-antitoxin system